MCSAKIISIGKFMLLVWDVFSKFISFNWDNMFKVILFKRDISDEVKFIYFGTFSKFIFGWGSMICVCGRGILVLGGFFL